MSLGFIADYFWPIYRGLLTLPPPNHRDIYRGPHATDIYFPRRPPPSGGSSRGPTASVPSVPFPNPPSSSTSSSLSVSPSWRNFGSSQADCSSFTVGGVTFCLSLPNFKRVANKALIDKVISPDDYNRLILAYNDFKRRS